MTGPTHRQCSISFSYLTMMLFYNLGITNINYYLALIVVLMTSKAGALFPDLDHNWENIGVKTVLNRIINITIHLTGGKHRSWQTHSVDICLLNLFLAYRLPNYLYELRWITSVNKEVLMIICLGFMSGWVSHIFADMLNGVGVRLFCWNKKIKVKFVPYHIGSLRFNTGNEWEAFIYKLSKRLNVILAIVCLLYPLL